MDEVAGLCARNVLASRAPTDLADARQDIGDRLLLSVMMDARAGSRRDLKQPAPHCRLHAELGGHCGQAQGARRLCRSRVEFARADNANGWIFGLSDYARPLVWNDMPRQLEVPWPPDVSAGLKVRCNDVDVRLSLSLSKIAACVLPLLRSAAARGRSCHHWCPVLSFSVWSIS